ncbi:MAG: DUF4845 domain-containing protein [Candidatus Thiodiazotropha lotti]|uniref:DUF4845 domain-containing protein n=1 Tax=Candidatus Thiodiazotropha lotti TaxID=2792787 RepID=A0A9E4MZ96_9GAMM|nr:DUF4845 domain-containing protein [Candidatus Thiodiazotropha lotti]ODB99161.1 hypothetical protein A3197_13510 [Candidatus Thiodiazotropha endoloripes]MCG7921143.1 DUF4845 domain-containing protein [Candidatus Thiodiazotropha lotti]MCG7929159.1 DUF4845 domain-containing protein [Candidatus Thiodiazotropha lotti]MCG7937294.1 DUF4845 domain-containing protein [Candidatus Thiodiazotropha lotti]
MQSIKKQRGLTFISWLVILIVAGFLVMVGIKVTPVYIDHFAVKSALESVKNEPFAERKSKVELRNMVLKRLDINSIRHVTKEHIKVKRDTGSRIINVSYEVRRHIAYNAALVMTFDETVELTSN